MAMKKTEQMYEKELAVLLSEGLDWIACYSCYPLSSKTEHAYDPTQAVIAAALHSLQREDVEGFLKIHRVKNLSYIQYPYMKSWLKDDHIFSKSVIVKCLITLAKLVVEEILSPQSPLVAAVTGLEEKYNLCGVFVQAVVLCAKRTSKLVQSAKRKAPAKTSASTQTCFEMVETVSELDLKKTEMIKILDLKEYGIKQKNVSVKTLLQYAVERKSAATVDKVMKLSGNLKTNDKSISGLLNLAVKRRSIKVIKTLLWHGLDRQFLDEDGNAPLHIAAASNYLKMVRMLSHAGADVNQTNRSGLLPLHLTADPEIISHLLDKGTDVEAKTPAGDTALHLAVFNGNMEAAEVLLRYGANPNETNASGITPLLIALRSYNEEMVDLVGQRNVVMETFCVEDEFFHKAITTGRLETVIEVPEEEETGNEEISNNPESVSSLPGLESDQDLRNDDGSTPGELVVNLNKDESLHKSIIKKQLGTVGEVSEEEPEHREINYSTESVSSRPNLERKTDGTTPKKLTMVLKKDGSLHKAATEGRLNVITQLLDGGVDVNTKGFGGYTALQYAAKYGHLSIVQLLIQRGADINLGNNWNWTPLHHAAHYSRHDIVKFLLEAGASPELVDTVYCKTPLSWATFNFKIIKLFKSKGIYN